MLAVPSTFAGAGGVAFTDGGLTVPSAAGSTFTFAGASSFGPTATEGAGRFGLDFATGFTAGLAVGLSIFSAFSTFSGGSGVGSDFATGFGVGFDAGFGAGLAASPVEKSLSKYDGPSDFGGFGFTGSGAFSESSTWRIGRASAGGRTSEMKSRAARVLRIGLIGNRRETVFYKCHLSSLTSMTSPNETRAMLRSWAEVDLGAILDNLGALKSQAVPGTKIMAVVKANAYGHGDAAVVKALAGQVEMFGVANLSEARHIAPHARGTPIFLLGATLPEEHETVAREGYIPAISTLEEAASYSACARGGKVRAHLAVDTGMGRLGIWEDDAIESARRIMSLPGLEITGICSHLPVADEDDAFTREQLARFHSLVEKLRAIGFRDALVHVENSAGVIAFPNAAGSLVRPGLALYGESPRAEFQSKLRRALTWKSRVTLVRDFGAGRGVSYGRTFITQQPMRIATLAAGYADGYPRQVSGHGAAVLIRGRRCPVLGRVTMDQIMVDVTGLDAHPGDEAVLIGEQGGEKITATELASLAGTIAWDIFTGIGPRVTRIYRNSDASASKPHFPA